VDAGAGRAARIAVLGLRPGAWSLRPRTSLAHPPGVTANAPRITNYGLRIRGLPFSPLSPYHFTTLSLAPAPRAPAIRTADLFTLVKTPLNSRLHSPRRAQPAPARERSLDRNVTWQVGARGPPCRGAHHHAGVRARKSRMPDTSNATWLSAYPA